LFHEGSTLLVVINALRLLAYPDVASRAVDTAVVGGPDQNPSQLLDRGQAGSKEASL
jgi:Cd2+/Zn2+-exporting ATPase